MKRVLILCTGNSCRSIIAEAILNLDLKDRVLAYSSGVKASGRVNPNAKKILESKGYWSDEYHSKTIDKVIDIDFDLVVTVCDNAKESCPIFPKKTTVVHIGFEDPDGGEIETFERCFNNIKETLLPKVKTLLNID
jgi:arsenate reductase